MYGQITDLQIFGSVLEEEEMERITGCTEFKEGDLVDMTRIDWVLD
jgi:hypothetical protein